jgi:diacylglycerol kinase family enzyme
MKTVALIVNPFSSEVSESRLAAVEEALSAHAAVETLRTERRGHATELAREAARSHDAVVVFSGDGVFNEVLNGVDRPIPLGFVPGGRTNVLPRALGLPRDPVASAVQIGNALEGERTRTISLGRANGRRFGFAAGVGADAELIRRMDERGRSRDGRLPGDLVAAWIFACELAAHRWRFEPALRIDGLGRAAFALVANGDPYTYAGRFGLHFTPRARFELGLDVVAPVSLNALSLPPVAVRALSGRGFDDRAGILTAHDLDRVEVVCDGPMPLQVDGEDLGDVSEARFECERAAVRVLVAD